MLHIVMPISFVLMNPVYPLYSLECAEYYHLTPSFFLSQNGMGALLVADRTVESSHTLDACTGNVSCASEPHRSERCKVSHDVVRCSATVHDAHGSCSPFDSRPPCESHADGV